MDFAEVGADSLGWDWEPGLAVPTQRGSLAREENPAALWGWTSVTQIPELCPRGRS